MIKKILTCMCLLFSTTFSLADEAYCTKVGNGKNKPIEEICMKGDIIEIEDTRVLQYCDFTKQIILSPLKKGFYVCQYLGYVRAFRSRVDGKRLDFIIDEK